LINGIYLATSGMNVEQKRMDVLSNNLANINTAGYKKEKLVFQVYKDRQIYNTSDSNQLGNYSGGIIIGQNLVDLTDGSLKYTENNLDFCVNGKNFFVVTAPDGQQYMTKDGSFNLNADGFLVNKDGYFVSGSNGNIQLTGPGDLSVDEKGSITFNNKNIGILTINSVAKAEDINMIGSSYFVLKNGAALTANPDVSVKQGYTEASNVNGVTEMVDMISITRAYEANQKILNMQDEMLKKATTEVGKV
jgi:flagellar basal-body rod protein FlgF